MRIFGILANCEAKYSGLKLMVYHDSFYHYCEDYSELMDFIDRISEFGGAQKFHGFFSLVALGIVFH